MESYTFEQLKEAAMHCTSNINLICDGCPMNEEIDGCRDTLIKSLTSYIEKAHQEGAEEAWLMAQDIEMREMDGRLSQDEYNAIMTESYQEARKKYDEYIEKNEIKVGDVVHFKNDDDVLIWVTSIRSANFNGIALNDVAGHCRKGDTYSVIANYKVKRTNRHIDLSVVLDQLNKEGE